MWLSLDWIKDYIDYDLDRTPNELGVLISLRVAEVEDVKICGEALSQVRVVEVIKTEPHPDADKLKLATITDGTKEVTIVCGAENCRAGIKLPFADLGSKFTLKDKEGKKFELVIKKTKIRGVESIGMLCSETELGLSDASDGVLELPADTPLGEKLSDLDMFKKIKDILFEIDNKSLTHRPDLWGHYGFARELSAIYAIPLKSYPGVELSCNKTSAVTIENQTPELCRRYSALEIKNIKVGPSPEWMQQRLRAVGLNSINNIVDITNYILLELGQPMHAFDVAKLADKKMIVRSANAGESFKALDEEDYVMTESDLVIDNGGKAVALAGVMGGAITGITEETTDLILESAHFAAATVRKTSNRLGLRSDSSMRFEKSLDPENTIIALQRAAQLITELCPEAEIVGDIADSFNSPYKTIEIKTNFDFIRKRLGCSDITDDFINSKLKSLGFVLKGDLDITVPSWRSTKDVEIAEDIVEEVGRMYGYDNITPYNLSTEIKPPAAPNNSRKLERQFKEVLTNGYGFSEILLYPWSGEKQLDSYGVASDNLMTLSNPLSEDAKFMRPVVMPLLIDAVAENLKYFNDFKMFEFGRVYDTTQMQGLLPTEKFKVSGCIVPEYKKNDGQTDSFYDAKRIVLDLLSIAGIANAQVAQLADKEDDLDLWIHPGIAAGFYRGRQKLAEIYKLHPNIAQEKGIKNNVYLWTIHFDEIEKNERKMTYKPISKYPEVTFDVTVNVGEKVLAGDIEKVISKSAKKLIKNIEVFSIYQGDGIEAGEKSISFRITYGADNRTLDSKEITQTQDNIMKSLGNLKF